MKFILTKSNMLININRCKWFNIVGYSDTSFIVQVGYGDGPDFTLRETMFSGTKQECINFVKELDRKINLD